MRDIDLSFGANSGLAWRVCGTSGIQEGPVAVAKCPFCHLLFTDPLFMETVKEDYTRHMETAHGIRLGRDP